jgi:hypothetical protein
MNKALTAAMRLAALSGLIYSTSAAFAASDLNVVAGVGAEYHDNAALVHDNEESDVDRIARAHIDLDRPDGPVAMKLGYDVERHDYQDNVQSDRTAINGSAMLNWQAIPRSLDFFASHQISDQLQDRRGTDVSSNLERRSIISVGGNGYAHPSKVDTLILSPRFSTINLQSSSGSDSRQSAVDLSWRHALSPVSALMLTGSRSTARFDDSVDNYDATRAMLSYNTRLSHLNYSVGGGFNRIKRDQGKDANGYSVQASADYVETYYSWGGAIIRQLTDSVIGLSGFETSVTDFRATDGNVDQFDIVETTQADLHGQRQLGQSSRINGSIGYLKYDYQQTPRDENTYYAQLGYSYSLNLLWSVGLNGRYEKRDFVDDPAGLVEKNKELELFADYRASQRLSIRFLVGREQRDANISANQYTDNYAQLSADYKFF